MTGGHIFVECLKAQGVEVIFGLPGNHLDTVYEALYYNQDSIRHYVTRHEGWHGVHGRWLCPRHWRCRCVHDCAWARF